jgi:PKD repeat protein
MIIKEKLLLLGFWIILCFFSLNLVSAEVYLGNLSHDLELNYGASDPLRGWINVSFNQSSEDILIKGFNSEISIKDFLESNKYYCNLSSSCSCFPEDCGSTYSSAGEALIEKNFVMTIFQSNIIGIKLTGDIGEITDFKFNLSTTAQKSCIPPLMIDFLDNGIDWKTQGSVEEECMFDDAYGCFELTHSSQNTQIGDETLCSVINLPSMSGFKIGAKVSGSGQAKFKLTLDVGSEQEECNSATSSGGEIGCYVSLSDMIPANTSAEVCISKASSYPGTASEYYISVEDNETCGYILSSGDSHDFEIYAKPLKYNAKSNIQFSQELLGNGFDLTQDLTDYILSRYNGNCYPECIIPLRFHAGMGQQLEISDLYLDYKTKGGLNPSGSDTDKFYEIVESPGQISSDYLKLDLEKAKIITPSSLRNHTLILEIGDKTINQEISVGNSTEIGDIFPNTAVSLVPTTFKVSLIGIPEGFNFDWDFGDNITETTTTNEIEHTYSKKGNYHLTVNISKGTWKKSKTITVRVEGPYALISETIRDYNQKLTNISVEINTFPGWLKDQVEDEINIQDLKDAVEKLETKYKSYPEIFEEEHREIMADLLVLKIPFRLGSELIINPVDFSQNKDRMNLAVIEDKLASSSIDPDEDYYDSINDWLRNNIDITIESKDYYIYYRDNSKDLMFSHIKMALKSKKSIDNFYVVLEGEEMAFKEDYDQLEINGEGYGLDLSFEDNETKTIEFTYPLTVEILNPPIYVSPEFEALELSLDVICNVDGNCDDIENWRNCRADCFPWIWTLLLLGILFFIGIVIYVFLQEWYKGYYEVRLFSNKNQLFNLITFMSNAMHQGLEKGNIFESLRSSGWKGEQLSYAWKKLHGKRTGMWEIPLFKASENQKIRSEISKRQNNLPSRGSTIGPGDGKDYSNF